MSRSGIRVHFRRSSTGLLQPQPAGCTLGGGSRSCPVVSSTLRGRCSSARANVVTCATLRFMFVMCFAVAHLARRDARASTRAHHRTCAGLVTWKTFDHEAVTNLECLFDGLSRSRRKKLDDQPCCPSVSCATLTHSAASSPPFPAGPSLSCFSAGKGFLLLAFAQGFSLHRSLFNSRDTDSCPVVRGSAVEQRA